MTTLDLEPIKERLAAATPGPWRVWHDPDHSKVRATAVVRSPVGHDAPSCRLVSSLSCPPILPSTTDSSCLTRDDQHLLCLSVNICYSSSRWINPRPKENPMATKTAYPKATADQYKAGQWYKTPEEDKEN